jgi:uncharacterized membrane protein YbaN (DUF454 family)
MAVAMDGPEGSGTVSGVRRAVYIALAGLLFCLGMIGTLLPGLPTTPFLILMSYFLIRSSPWLHRKVVRLPIVGPLIQEWREKRGVSVRVKVVACLMVFVVVAASIASEVVGLSLKISIGLLAACGIWVVLRIPTVGG